MCACFLLTSIHLNVRTMPEQFFQSKRLGKASGGKSKTHKASMSVVVVFFSVLSLTANLNLFSPFFATAGKMARSF